MFVYRHTETIDFVEKLSLLIKKNTHFMGK